MEYSSARGKSGQHRTGQSLTTTGGDPRESATETIPPRLFWRGKGERSAVHSAG